MSSYYRELIVISLRAGKCMCEVRTETVLVASNISNPSIRALSCPDFLQLENRSFVPTSKGLKDDADVDEDPAVRNGLR